jgi:ribosome-associated protein
VNRELFTASLSREARFSFSRSEGAGGQNVNKVNTRVTVSVPLEKLAGLTETEITLIKTRLASRLSAEGCLTLSAQDTRSQARNRTLALTRIEALIIWARRMPARRRPTRPTASSCRKRLESKKITARKKGARKKPDAED